MNPYWNLNLETAIPMAAIAVVVLSVPLWLATRSKTRPVRLIVRGLVLPLLLLLNPFSGWILWEPINKHLLTSMKLEAERVGMEGKTFAEVRNLFGEPGFVWDRDKDGVVTWNYPRPRLYLFGSKFQVHFKGGVVYGWEPYDD